MNSTLPPPHLTDAQLDAAAEALSRAFFEDPLQTYILPDADARARLSPPFFNRIVRHGQLFGEVLTTPGTPRAAAVWLPPGATEMTSERMEQAGMMELPKIVGEAFDRFGAVMDVLDPFHRRHAPGPHWYLAVIGVDPGTQASGVGRGLIEYVVSRADAAGVPCYLETAQPRNVQFYLNRGFELRVDTTDPLSGLRLWTFLRMPP